MFEEKSEHLAATEHVIDVLLDFFGNVGRAGRVTDQHLLLPLADVRPCRSTRYRAPPIYRLVDIERLFPTLFLLFFWLFIGIRSRYLHLAPSIA